MMKNDANYFNTLMVSKNYKHNDVQDKIQNLMMANREMPSLSISKLFHKRLTLLNEISFKFQLFTVSTYLCSIKDSERK